MTIFCRTCKGETTAQKKRGPLPGSKRCAWVWWNVCNRCGTHYSCPPPLVERMRKRSYARASGQMELL